MKKDFTPLTDEYLESLAGMEMAKPKDFFYSRLLDRLEQEENEQVAWAFPLKPIWMISSLAVFLIINIIVLSNGLSKVQQKENTAIESFANAYDQNINSSY